MKKKFLIFPVFLIIIVIVAYLALAQPNVTPSSVVLFEIGISLHDCTINDAQLVNDSGAQWIRIDVSENISDAVANAKAHNLKVLGVLGSWMFDKRTVFSIEEWKSNVTHFVQLCADSVDAWEIWNEPVNPRYPLLNLNITAPNSQNNMTTIAQFYYNMTRDAYSIIRSNNAAAKIVLLGGLNLFSGGDPNLNLDEEFARQLAATDIAQYGDAISVHAYPWSGVQEPAPQLWGSYTKSLNHYRSLFPNLKIWVTETGTQYDQTSPNTQKDYMTDTFQFFNGTASHVFWYSMYDNSWELPQQFGLLNNDGTPRPAYTEMQKMCTSFYR